MACTEPEYGVPAVPLPSVVVVMESGGPVTVIERTVPSLLPRKSETLTLTRKFPARVGLPENTPPLDSETPGGRLCPSANQVKGVTPPIAASEAE